MNTIMQNSYSKQDVQKLNFFSISLNSPQLYSLRKMQPDTNKMKCSKQGDDENRAMTTKNWYLDFSVAFW